MLKYQNNLVDRLRKNAFQKLTGLQNLQLSGNRISKIHSSAFKGLANLVNIDFSGNLLTAVPAKALRDASRLQVLKLNNNQISTLENETFTGLSELERLEMNGCQLRTIQASAFKGLTKLQYLYLAENQLSTLPRDTFADMRGVGNLRLLHLYKNPWDCTCNLRWLRVWIKTDKITYDFDGQTKNTRCSKPKQLRDQTWDSLDSDRFACAPVLYSEPHRVINVHQGGEVNFTCRVYLDPPKQVRWYHEGRAIRYYQGREYYINNPSSFDERNKTSVLAILKATDATSGEYRCEASNDAGSVAMNVTINVHNSFINSASLGTTSTSGVIAGVLTALLIFVVIAGIALFYVMNKRDTDQTVSGGSVSTSRGLPLKGGTMISNHHPHLHHHHHHPGGLGGGPPMAANNVSLYSNQADLELEALDGMVGGNNGGGHFLGSPVHALDDSLSLQMDPYGHQVRVSTGNYAQYTLQRTAMNPLAAAQNGAQHLQGNADPYLDCPPMHRSNQHSWGNDPMEPYDFDDDDDLPLGSGVDNPNISKTEHLTLTFHESFYPASSANDAGSLAAGMSGAGIGGDVDVVMRNRSTQVPTPTDEDAFIPGPSMSERLRTSDTKEKLANIPE